VFVSLIPHNPSAAEISVLIGGFPTVGVGKLGTLEMYWCSGRDSIERCKELHGLVSAIAKNGLTQEVWRIRSGPDQGPAAKSRARVSVGDQVFNLSAGSWGVMRTNKEVVNHLPY
jgi:hypothetical protein